MNFYKYFLILIALISNSQNIFCMDKNLSDTKKLKQEELSKVPKLSKDPWNEIIKFVGGINFKSEGELIQAFNSLRATNKQLNSLVNEYLKSKSTKYKNIPYNYKDFMIEFLDKYISEKAGSRDETFKLNAAVKLDSTIWLKDYLSRANLQEIRNTIKFEAATSVYFDQALHGATIKILENNLNKSPDKRDYDLINKLLISTAQTNDFADILNEFVKKNDTKMVKLLLDKLKQVRPADNFKSLLDACLKIANKKIYDKVGFLRYYSGKYEETEEIKPIDQMIKLINSYKQ